MIKRLKPRYGISISQADKPESCMKNITGVALLRICMSAAPPDAILLDLEVHP